MRPINYWITFTARDDKYREVLAVRMAFSLSDDYRSTRAEIPAFGIVAEGEQAQGKALERLYVVLARSHNGQLRQGLQAQATYAETRNLLIAERDGAMFTPERYRAEEKAREWLPNANLYWLLEANAAELDAAALATGDAETMLGPISGFQPESEPGSGEAVADALPGFQTMDFNNLVDARLSAPHDLNPVTATEQPTIENIPDVECVNRRVTDDEFPAQYLDPASGLSFEHSGSNGAFPCQLSLFGINDVAGINPQRAAQLKGQDRAKGALQDIKGPPSEVNLPAVNDSQAITDLGKRPFPRSYPSG